VAEVLSGRSNPPAIIGEKPLAPTLEQAKAHMELAGKYGIPIMIAENYRYSEDVNIIRDLVREGHTGETAYFLYHRAHDFPGEMRGDTFAAKEWRQHPEFPGGIFYDSGVHDMAALRHIFGGIDEVFAFGRRHDSTLGQLAIVQVNLRFLSGLTGQYTFYAGGPELVDPPAGFRIIGDKGQIYQADRNAGVIHLAYADGSAKEISYRPQRGFYNELLNLYNACTGKEPIAVTPEMAFDDAKTIFAILKSLAEGVPIPVPDYQGAYGHEETTQPAGY
jgi:predicted dehydrogenase